MDEKGVGVCEPPQPACSEGDRHRAGDVAPWCARKREKRCAKRKREMREEETEWSGKCALRMGRLRHPPLKEPPARCGGCVCVCVCVCARGWKRVGRGKGWRLGGGIKKCANGRTTTMPVQTTASLWGDEKSRCALYKYGKGLARPGPNL